MNIGEELEGWWVVMSEEKPYSHLDAASMRRAAGSDPSAGGSAAAEDLVADDVELATARRRIGKALALHRPSDDAPVAVCVECSRLASPATVPWPCPTAIALGRAAAESG